MQRNLSDWGGNIVALAVTIVVNGLANALPINGQNTGEVSAKFPTLFTPAGFTFGIWGFIYLALVGFVIYQALPAQRNDAKLASIGNPFKLNCLANAGWIFAWHYQQWTLSLLLMGVILGTLLTIYTRLAIDYRQRLAWRQALLVHLPFSVYTGWIVVASIANISVVQTVFGVNGWLLGEIHWALVKLTLAGAIAAMAVLRRGDIPLVLVIAWAAVGIAVNQQATQSVSMSAWALVLVGLLLASTQVVGLIRRP